MKKIFLLISLHLTVWAFAQNKNKPVILLVPYQPIMYFSDADQDIARFSNTTTDAVKNIIRTELDSKIQDQLMSDFEVVSLMRTFTIDGEKDLNRIYAATRYLMRKHAEKEELESRNQSKINKTNQAATDYRFTKNNKANYLVSDSTVMLAEIVDKDLCPYFSKKFNYNYLLFITQFEINTDNKNTIEWTKQEYTRAYTLHYNLFDNTGRLLKAETTTIKAGNDNKIQDINNKYLSLLAQKLGEKIKSYSNE